VTTKLEIQMLLPGRKKSGEVLCCNGTLNDCFELNPKRSPIGGTSSTALQSRALLLESEVESAIGQLELKVVAEND
jgi:hypothetical protein